MKNTDRAQVKGTEMGEANNETVGRRGERTRREKSRSTKSERVLIISDLHPLKPLACWEQQAQFLSDRCVLFQPRNGL